MSTDVNITYVNNSLSSDNSTIFVFSKNAHPTIDAVQGVAWRTMPQLKKGESHTFTYHAQTTVRVVTQDSSVSTSWLDAVTGKCYEIKEDDGNLLLQENGSAQKPDSIEVVDKTASGRTYVAELAKDGKVLMSRDITKKNNKAIFVLQGKLYWGITSDIQEGEKLGHLAGDADSFFEQDIEGVSNATVTLTGNPQEGYRFSSTK